MDDGKLLLLIASAIDGSAGSLFLWGHREASCNTPKKSQTMPMRGNYFRACGNANAARWWETHG